MNEVLKDLEKDIKENSSYFKLLIPLIIVAIIFCIIINIGIHKVDTFILDKISLIVTSNLTVLMKLVTSMCTPIAMLSIVLLYLLILKNKKVSIGVTFCLLFTGISNLVLKAVFSRQRPLEYMLIDESGYSFPSGHSMVSIAFYGFLIYVGYNMIKNKVLRNIYICVHILLIALIAFSRLYLGVHYPTDVLAGLMFGYVTLFAYIKLFSKYIIDKKESSSN